MATQPQSAAPDPGLEMLRHTLATLAYRGGKAVRGAPDGFSGFRAGGQTRTPGEILAHIGDLLDWGLSMAQGQETWRNSPPLAWDRDVQRFFAALEAFDARLSSGLPLAVSAERLFQGPIADALAHTGQIALLRRLAGAPIRGENYFLAHVQAGRVSSDQPAPVKEFE